MDSEDGKEREARDHISDKSTTSLNSQSNESDVGRKKVAPRRDGTLMSYGIVRRSSAICNQHQTLPTRSLTLQAYRLDEKHGNLFTEAEKTDSLAHCVSVDLHMGKGIALTFKKQFKGVEELQKQEPKVGGTVQLKRGDRYIYYLVTKPRYFDKPTYDTLRSSLLSLKQHCLHNEISRLAMPRIGCGLDMLEWSHVVEILGEVLCDTNIHVTVFYL